MYVAVLQNAVGVVWQIGAPEGETGDASSEELTDDARPPSSYSASYLTVLTFLRLFHPAFPVTLIFSV